MNTVKNEIEERELFEQQQKIFEAVAQRADKRTGSFSFLTWPFFIAPLIASEEFLAATFNSAAAEEEGAKAARADAAPQAADDPPAHDPSKASAENDTAKEPAALSAPHPAQVDPTGLPAEPREDAPKPSTAGSEAVAAGGGGGGGGGGGDTDSSGSHTQTSIHGSSVNALSAVPHLGSSQLSDGSTFESVQPNVIGGSLSPSIVGPAQLAGTVGSLSKDVAGAVAPVEAAVQPVLATVSDSAGTLSHDVAGATAPVEAAVQPVLATVSDSVGTLSHDVAGAVAPVEAAAQPVLVSDTVGTLTHDLSHPTDTGNGASSTHPNAAPVVDTTTPALTITTAAVSHTTSDLSHPTDIGDGASATHPGAAPGLSTGQVLGPADTLLALATATDAPIQVPGSATAAPANVATDASNAASAVHATAIAGDVIAFNDAPPPPANALFNGTQYTHYGVTLSSDIAVAPQNTVSPADATSAHDTSAPVLADAQKHAPPPPDIVDTTHPIDHLAHAIL